MLYRDEKTVRQLVEQLRAARAQYAAARENFDAVISEVPSGLPHPDGVMRIEQAGKESRRTRELYTKALMRYSDFVLHGVVPPDLEIPP